VSKLSTSAVTADTGSLMTQRLAWPLLAIVAALSCASCSSLAPPKTDLTEAIQHRVEHVTIGNAQVDLHLAELPGILPDAPLVIFASGDGGWFGSAVGMFETIAAGGYPVAGVSARALLRGLRGEGRQISTSHVRQAYREIIRTARSGLGLSDTRPIIIAGWSRGAALAIIVGAEHPGEPIVGVLGIGMAADEDLNVDLDSDDDTAVSPAAPGRLDTYSLSRQVTGSVAVIQSTGDGYLPAKQARLAFGADSVSRRFFEVGANNHRFSGGEGSFRRVVVEALNWISTNEGAHQ